MKRKTALAVILALSFVLIACGGSDDKAAVDEISETPAPTQVAPATPTANLTEESAATSNQPIDMVEHLRAKTFLRWDVYNTHDSDALVVFYSDNYREEEKQLLRSNMQPFKSRGITFTAEETSPPAEISPGKWETKHTSRFPGGLVNMVFVNEEFEGEWLLTFAKLR